MKLRRCVAFLLSAIFVLPASAEAATVSGSATDRGEGVALDARRVQVSYDRDAGRVAASVRLDSATNPEAFGGSVKLSVGRLGSNGRCVTTGANSLRMDSTLIWDIAYGNLWRAGFADTPVVAEVLETFPDYVYTFEAEWLKRQDYRCVTDIRLESETGVDSVKSFTLRKS